MIVEAFLRWAETAKAGDRARAASALGRAYLQSTMPATEREAAVMAMTHLLDDPSPKVRLALAEALAHGQSAPRNIILSLAQDQPEIAGQVVIASPVLNDTDLVDLAVHGSDLTRILIASRGEVSRMVSAALAEIGEIEGILCLLENRGASISPPSLKRIAERLGHFPEVRNLLTERESLPAEARHVLVQQVSDALAHFPLAQATIGADRLERITREANESAAVTIAGTVAHDDIPGLVEHLRTERRLTPAFLMHALCSGKIDFFAAAIVNLSGCDERRVRSILATGRMHAVRALYESAGLKRDVSVLFVEATLLWRNAARAATGRKGHSVSLRLLKNFGRARGAIDATGELLNMVERLHMAEDRQAARGFAALSAPAAA